MSKLKKYKLDKLYEISSGISTKPEQYGKGSPFLSFSTIFNNYFLPDELPELMNTSETEQLTYSVKKGDVFLTRTSETLDELAMSCVALKDYPKATFSGFAKRLRPVQDNITYNKFMGFFLRSKYFRKIIDNNAIMTLRASFNEKIFSYLNVELPIYDEQVKIGNLLHLFEEKIKLNNKINAELEKMAKNLYNYWFVQFDFPDENGHPYKSSGGKMVYDEKLKREIPYKWSANNVKTCIEHINTGLNPRDNFVLNNGNIKYITVKNLTTQGSIDFSNCDTINEIAQKIVHKRSDISKGDILFASIAPLGRCYLIQEEPQTWDINESVFSIRPKNTMPSEYLYMFLMSEIFVKKAENSSTGSVFAGIRIKTLEDMPLVIPEENILQQFKEKISKILFQKYIKECENQELAFIRDFLLPMLMNGQVSVADSQEDNLSEEKIIKKSLEFWQSHGKMDIDQFARENGILVYKDNEQKKGVVSYNAEKDLYEIAIKDPRDNFTIAHEIGHILKHKNELKTGTLGRKSEESGTKIMEHEADSLAAKILMPEKYVLQYMQDKNKTEKDYLDEKFVKECAKYFNVNPPAINIHLKNLGYKVPYIR